MSDAAIIKEVKGLLDKFTDKEIRKKEGLTKIHRVTFTTTETVSGLLNGADSGLDIIFPNEPMMRDSFKIYNTKAIWSRIVRNMFTKFTNGGTLQGSTLIKHAPIKDFNSFKGASKSLVYVLPKSNAENFTIEIRKPSSNRTVYTFCAAFRKEAWKVWCDTAKAKLNKAGFTEAGSKEGMANDKTHHAIGIKTPMAHHELSTIGLARIEIVIADMKEMEIQSDMQFFTETIDLPAEILRLAKIHVRISPKYKQGTLVGEERIVYGEMKQQSKETTDFTAIRKRVLEELPIYLEKNKSLLAFTDKETAMTAKASNSYKKDAAASNAKSTVDRIKKSLKKAGVKGKVTVSRAVGRKRQPRSVHYTYRPTNKSSVHKGVINLSAAVYKLTVKKEKGQDNGADLRKLKKQINKRLPAETRRNMGKPALTNQTGRFSNSVQLLNLRTTAGGISGEYTYQRNPYQTFENTGSRKWPSGYNPKPLIAKSIRQLAMQYTEQKLTSLRRT